MIAPKFSFFKKNKIIISRKNHLRFKTKSNYLNNYPLFLFCYNFFQNNFFLFKYSLSFIKGVKSIKTSLTYTLLPIKQQKLYTLNFFKKRFNTINTLYLSLQKNDYLFSLERFFFFVG